MLIEFSVANFGSFKESQMLDMVPVEENQSMPEHCFSTGLSDHPQQLLRSAMVYGANASGKTHLVKAALFMREMILNSNRKSVEEPIKTNPFLLDAKTRSAPCAFQMVFVVDGQRHQYGFKVDGQRVCSEWCYIFSRHQEATRSFRREYDPNEDLYHVETDALDGLEDALHVVPEDWLAITQFGQEKKQRWPELAATYRWFQHRLRIIHSNTTVKPLETYKLCETVEGRDWALSFLKAADLGVESLDFKGVDITNSQDFMDFKRDYEKTIQNKNNNLSFGNMIEFFISKRWEELDKLGIERPEKKMKMVRVVSQTGETVSVEMDMESTGTQKMFELAGRWKEVLSEGQVFFVDEIETGLHHQLVCFLLELIHDPERNPHGAQLIATTHDTALLDEKIIRPDQIWLMNKNREYASHMFPLSDFDIKLGKGESLQQFYLDGLYGAVPMVRKRRVPVSMSETHEFAGGTDAKKSNAK